MRWWLLFLTMILGIAVLMLALKPRTESAGAAASASLAVAATATSGPAISNAPWYPVVKVVDGDTIVVSKNGTNETVRLIGIDTPETVDPRKTVQCFGKEASDKTRQIVQGQSVRLELDPSQGERDKYGRLLAYVYAPLNVNPAGLLVNEYLIAEGYAHEYTYNLPYQYQKEFKAAEAAARETKKGLWADSACAQQSLRSGSTRASSTAVTKQLTVSSFTPTKKYACDHNVYNCADFSSQTEAQYVFELCGADANDIHQLDRDRDGTVCESLP